VLQTKNALTGEIEDIEGETEITDMTPNSISLNIKFENPFYVSQVLQSTPDDLIVKFPENLVLTDKQGNSLVFYEGQKSQGSIDFVIPI